jgi:hypothetical protein
MEREMERPVDGLLSAISMPDCKKIHFVDAENLLGSGVFSPDDVRQLAGEYVIQTKSEPSDLFFIASGPQNKQALLEGWSWGNKFFQFRKGKDGADIALISLFSNIVDLGKYSEIYVGSGDGALLEIAKSALEKGVGVSIVTGKGTKSRSLESFPEINLSFETQLAAAR